MPEFFNQPVTLDRIVTVRKEDPAFVILDKRLDYTVGSGGDVAFGEDGAIFFYAGSTARYSGAASFASITGFRSNITIVYLGNRDRTGFDVRQHLGTLQQGDFIFVTAKLGNIAFGGTWTMRGVIDIARSTTANALPANSHIITFYVGSWAYVGGPLRQTSLGGTLGDTAYVGEGAYVELVRPTLPTFVSRRRWAERIDTGVGEEIPTGEGDPISIAFATFRMRYDFSMTKLTSDGRIDDDEGNTWEVIGLQEQGRKRFLDVQCRRVGAP